MIETILEEKPSEPTAPPQAAADRGATEGDPIQALVDKERRGEALTPNEQALIDLLRKDPRAKR